MAVAHSLFTPTTLTRAIARLGYVQADPIRAPARAQDLILRLRVRDYRVDDLERHYPQIDVDEDALHNYGFFPQENLKLLYPRRVSGHSRPFFQQHRALRKSVLAYLAEHGEAHPRRLDEAHAAGRRTNGWGGSSSATTLLLEALHRRGMLRVLRREDGIRVYGPAPTRAPALSPTARADGILQLILNLYAPMPTRSLMQTLSMMSTNKPALDYPRRVAQRVAAGEWREAVIDGLPYLWPSAMRVPRDDGETLRVLAPFDPVVWDRRRFEHLWGWAYRFEAYTPAARRVRGYYALPLLWRSAVIGWANVDARGSLELGFVGSPPRDRAFKRALDEEATHLKDFLRPQN